MNAAARPVFRFAPSPNGELHLGHALSALLNARLARRAGGCLLLRVEDIDLERARPEFEAAIYRDLEWLGLEWERPVRRQSEHFADYRAALDRLEAEGLLYPAFMSRGEVRAFVAENGRAWPRDPDGAPLYPDLDRGRSERDRRRLLAEGRPHALRLDMAAAVARAGALVWAEAGSGPRGETGEVAADPSQWGDVMLARSDRPASYHLCVTVDDALQGVTDVVRGRDLFHATAVHRLLQELLGLPAPRYRHHQLVLGPEGRKLSKSLGDHALRRLRVAGLGPDEILAMLEPLEAAGDLEDPVQRRLYQ